MALATVTAGAPTAPTLPTLQRRIPHHRARVVAFYDPRSGRLALDSTATRGVTLPDTRASALLAFCASLSERERPRVVFICGGDAAQTAPSVVWFREPVAHGWAMDRWYNGVEQRTGVYSRGDVTLDLRLAAPWFGGSGAALDAETCLDAWNKLRRALRFAFGDTIDLMNTPGMTGSELLEASLAYGVRVPTLPDELRSEIRSFTTQGRRELFAPATPLFHEAWLADATWQYAACVHQLPMGRVTRDRLGEFAGYTPGFYRVVASVPRGWSHLGLLPRRETDGAITYPRRPRQRFEAWVTGAEAQLAIKHDWSLTIHERILWPETGRHTDPAKLWISKLRELRAMLLKQNTAVSHLAAGAVRHLALDTIGRWHAAARDEYGVLPLARINELPTGAIPHIEAGEVLWMRPAQPDPKLLLKFSHPEWSATVWGRSRARTAAFALTLPYASLMRIHTDGVWTTASLYALAERQVTAQPGVLPPGTWRIKASLEGPLTWPRSEAEFLSLLALAQDEGEG